MFCCFQTNEHKGIAAKDLKFNQKPSKPTIVSHVRIVHTMGYLEYLAQRHAKCPALDSDTATPHNDCLSHNSEDLIFRTPIFQPSQKKSQHFFGSTISMGSICALPYVEIGT